MVIRTLGVVVDLDVDYRVIKLKDRYFVIGHGRFMSVESYESGRRLIRDLRKL